jgi:hypothetical protein
MSGRLVFVAGPYAGPTPEAVQYNVWRALCLGALAVRRGFVPIVPHAPGWLGVYGPADESLPEARAQAIRCSRELARQVGLCRGELWVIEQDDLTLSLGTAAEHDAFSAGVRDSGYAGQVGRFVTHRPWSEWMPLVAEIDGGPPIPPRSA